VVWLVLVRAVLARSCVAGSPNVLLYEDHQAFQNDDTEAGTLASRLLASSKRTGQHTRFLTVGLILTPASSLLG